MLEGLDRAVERNLGVTGHQTYVYVRSSSIRTSAGIVRGNKAAGANQRAVRCSCEFASRTVVYRREKERREERERERERQREKVGVGRKRAPCTDIARRETALVRT